MDLRTKLHSILWPGAKPVGRAPANRSHPAGKAFAATLAQARVVDDPSIGTFGVRPGQGAASGRVTVAAPFERPPIEPGGPTTARPGVPAVVDPPKPSLPPIGVEWASLLVAGSGVQGLGVDGSTAGLEAQLEVKFQQYSHPEGQGVRLNTEGRLFRDAVARGYVPNTPAGLGTLLGYLGMGAFDFGRGPVRPAEMTVYFNQFFAGERAAGLV